MITNHFRSRAHFLAAVGAAGSSLGAPIAARAADKYTLRLNSGLAATSPQVVTALRFAAAVARRTNGQVNVEIYPNYQLGIETTAVESLTTGTVDFYLIGTGPLVPLVGRLQIFDMPFLFKDVGFGFSVLDGPIGAELGSELESRGILALGWGTSGMRELETSGRAINTPEDLKGLRIRIQAGAVYVATFQALGAIPVVISSSEAFVALSQHTVDGLDSDITSVVSGKFYTVCKHLALTNQVFAPQAFFASRRRLETLPAPLQKIVKEEVKAVLPFWRNLVAKLVTENIDFLKKNDVTFTEPQIAPFKQMVQPVYAAYQSRPGGEFINRINERTRGG